MSSSARSGAGHDFCLIVPVKRLNAAKSRLAADVEVRAALMRAFARDAITAATASPAVSRTYVVSGEPALDLAGLDGVALVEDHGAGDLNAALRHAERAVRLRHPGLAVAALCADVPGLRTEDLTAALTGSLASRWYVADAAGTGTTLLAAGPGLALDPHFGADSARRHEESGAVPVRAHVPSLRHDVDTDADLRAAERLGVGRATRAALDALRG